MRIIGKLLAAAALVGSVGTGWAVAQQCTPEPETCDGFDNDCDGVPDDGNPGGDAPCDTGQSGVCGSGVSSCLGGTLVCIGPDPSPETCDELDNDCDGIADDGVPTEETCNGADDDCDGTIDDGLAQSTWYQDADSDTFGNSAVTTQACGPPSGFVAAGDDCDDTNPSIHPNAVEVCNGADDDCDGLSDGEDASLVCDDLIDVDGNGTVSALTDALLLLRWAFGLDGTALTSGAVAPNCTRCTAAQIIDYIEQTLIAPDP